MPSERNLDECVCDDPFGLMICYVHCKCDEPWSLCPLHTRVYRRSSGLHCRAVWQVLADVETLFRLGRTDAR